jgi:hypothetical protein
MADPRKTGPQQRTANYSPLMKQLMASRITGDVANACPFGCEDHELDEKGACAHLIGFYDKGNTYEPRIKQKKDGRVIVSGKARKPMQKGFKLVRITTTARVYSPEPNKFLTVTRDETERFQVEIMEQERQLVEVAEKIRNPVLEGDWGESAYDVFRKPAPAPAG